jgi:methionyl-tRNA formyltransferase
MSSDASGDGTRARVLLVGEGPTTESALASLVEAHEVVALLRGGDACDPAVQLAEAHGVPVHTRATVASIKELVEALRPDCVVVSSFGRILPAPLLEACPFLNVHYSPLPRYRGRANVTWAVINGETEAAISLHELVSDLDAGGLLFQERVPIGPHTTTTELYTALNRVQQRELGAAVTRLLAGDHGQVQQAAHATHGCTRVPDDGELDWTAATVTLDRLVRGLTWPAQGAFTYLGLTRVWVDRAEPAPESVRWEGRVPGRVVWRSPDEGWVDVLTGDGVLRLHEVRVEDSAAVPAAKVFTSVRATLGLRTSDLVREIARLQALVSAFPPEG